ncbi:MAG: hypothetical protein JXA33_11670 [Anaerolineae bacterium]|nr:hypothetical protein [Anaerolineae bacterium]
MNLNQVMITIEGEILVAPENKLNLVYGFSSDLMSDVLVHANSERIASTSEILLITGLTNPQSVRTAEMADIPAIVFVRGKYPPAQTVTLAEASGIALIVSPYTMYETAGLLFQAGLQGIGKVAFVRQ